MSKETDLDFLNIKSDKVIGVDEVGRGCFAGPVVTCSFCIEKEFYETSHYRLISDSKVLTSKKREKVLSLYQINIREIEPFKLYKGRGYSFYVSLASVKKIDQINILQATLSSMKEGTEGVLKKSSGRHTILIDGNQSFYINEKYKRKTSQVLTIKKGDQKYISIGMASITAKVWRDFQMMKVAKKYGNYDFENNKGYGTSRHLRAIEKYGRIEGIHRTSFRTQNEKKALRR